MILPGQPVCRNCGAALFKQWYDQGKGGWVCRSCGELTTVGNVDPVASGARPPILVRTYAGKDASQAAIAFQMDAPQMAAAGYYPVSQSWAGGSWGAGAWLLALLLLILLIGIFVIIFLLVVKPDGTLTVTYQLQQAQAPAAQPAPPAAPPSAPGPPA